MIRKRIIPLVVKAFDPLVRNPRWRRLQTTLDAMARVDDFFFVQIGANDGFIHDPLYNHIVRHNWRGILVEPVKCYFNRLKQNYSNNNRLIFENVAIAEHDGTKQFFRIREGLDFLPTWTKGLGSFRLDVLLKHRWVLPNIKDYIVTETVECLSFASLLNRHAIKKIDLILIDTEGYDFEVLKQLDFDRIKPAVIVYEHKHISKTERQNCETLLRTHEYSLERWFNNTLAQSCDDPAMD